MSYMTEELKLYTIVAITIVLLALIAWGCNTNRENHITRRIIATNTVGEVPNK